MKFSMTQLWNDCLEIPDERPLITRDYIWASEIGKPFIDRFLSMTATPYSNPPNARSRRKFVQGNIVEWQFWYLLSSLGLLISHQGRSQSQQDGCLMVSGKKDFLVGGKPNADKGMKTLHELGLPIFYKHLAERLIEGDINYDNTVVECKSTASTMFAKYESTRRANKHHIGQLYHYMDCDQLPGLIFYISKDDSKIIEFRYELDNQPAKEFYLNDIKRMTQYYLKSENPRIEPPLEIDDEGYFNLNWGIEYSQYLTLLYQYQEPKDFRDDWEPRKLRWNRVIDRVKEKKDMTKDNLLALDEIERYMAAYRELKNL